MNTNSVKMTAQSFLGTFWRTQPMEFTYPKLLRRYKKILLIMPRDDSALHETNRWRERIILALGRKHVNVLSVGASLEFLQQWSEDPLFFTGTDINLAGMVSARVISAVRKKNFKLVIDLSPDYDFVTAQIALRSKIPARIGMISDNSKTIARKYFNIIVHSDFRRGYQPLVDLLSAK